MHLVRDWTLNKSLHLDKLITNFGLGYGGHPKQSTTYSNNLLSVRCDFAFLLKSSCIAFYFNLWVEIRKSTTSHHLVLVVAGNTSFPTLSTLA